MKNIAIIAIVLVSVIFSSTSFAKKLDISEKGVKAYVKEVIKEDGSPSDVIRYKEFKIVERSEKETQFGRLEFFVIIALIDVKGDGQYRYVSYVYTGEKGNKTFLTHETYSASISDQKTMAEYKRRLKLYSERVKTDGGVAQAGLKLAFM